MSGRFTFLTSATRLEQCPADMRPEIAVLGRSNSGKSTLINAWAQSQIAKTSSTPGKTRLINFFDGPHYRLVDFPGYGYSARSGDEQASWGGMIESFLSTRGSLKGALLLMDCRRDWTNEEAMLLKFMQRRGSPMAVVLTKSDKLNRSEEDKMRAKFKQLPGVSAIFFTSSTKRKGLDELEDYVYRTWVLEETAP
ncbi:ribosome biogenesis GTP-binding protein YihA/YsxC [soil metagenome]